MSKNHYEIEVPVLTFDSQTGYVGHSRHNSNLQSQNDHFQ